MSDDCAGTARNETPSLFQQRAKPLIVRVSSRLAAVGLGVLVLTLAGSVLLVVDVTSGRAEGILVGAGTLPMCVGLWGVPPRLARRPLARVEAALAEEPDIGLSGDARPSGVPRGSPSPVAPGAVQVGRRALVPRGPLVSGRRREGCAGRVRARATRSTRSCPPRRWG
ncbi:DUF6328 family protein [Streptomyces venezuelae]|uniref:DUF6328 family protein n=1 Tax=Streptomyces venezuelae TaxID=54571 RepID=UPI0037B1D565